MDVTSYPAGIVFVLTDTNSSHAVQLAEWVVSNFIARELASTCFLIPLIAIPTPFLFYLFLLKMQQNITSFSLSQTVLQIKNNYMTCIIAKFDSISVSIVKMWCPRLTHV